MLGDHAIALVDGVTTESCVVSHGGDRTTQENEEEWDNQLPTVLLGYRATIQASIRYTLFHLLHAREMTVPMTDMARLSAPAVGYEDPTAQAMMDRQPEAIAGDPEECQGEHC